MPSTSLPTLKLFFLLTLISIAIAVKNGMGDNLDAIFRPYRSRNMKRSETFTARDMNGLAGLIDEGQKKAECYRGGYRTGGGGGTGGGIPIIIIGGGGPGSAIPIAGGAVPGAGGAIPGAGGAGTATGGFTAPGAAASGTAPGGSATVVPTA